MVTVKELFDLDHTLAADYLRRFEYPWQALAGIGEMILQTGSSLPAEYRFCEGNIWIHETASIAKTATIIGPCIIGKNTEVRPGAFIRGNALVGDDCVVGNSTELKNVILFDHVQVPHYNYVGDSILGYYSHMGAGSITSNVKSDKKPVVIKDHQNGRTYETGRKKVGAMLGSHVEIGCGSILNPGVIVGSNTNIYPLSSVRGVVPADSIYKREDRIVEKVED